MNRSLLIEAIRQYKTEFTAEQKFVSDFLTLLQHPRAFHRDHIPGHITGSVWIVDDSRQFILLTHHAKLNKWLQPGGHADGDENVLQVALREAEEETGLRNYKLLQDHIFDLDIHTIPARKDFAAHLHYDVRFLIQADRNEKLSITDESNDLQWIHRSELSHYSDNASILRMAQKTP